MFEPASRYASLESVRHTLPDGRVVAYKRRRFLPPVGTMTLLVEVTLAEGERLDQVAAHTLGDPGQYWRICDASGVLHPATLTGEPGRVLRVPVPES